MTAISDDHVEWAVTDRLCSMLMAKHKQYNVSHTYAMFVGILCWTMQRIRKPDGLLDSLKADLILSNLLDEPWNIKILDTSKNSLTIMPNSSLLVLSGEKDVTPWRLILALRNALAHGDARNVTPCHRQAGSGPTHELIGFTIHCDEKDKRKKVIWEGTITLLESDMRRIGSALATSFRDNLQLASGQSQFAEEATNFVDEKAA